MLAIEGLALGLLCGLIASLFRLVKPAFSIAISSVFFTIWTCGFGFYTLLTQSSHSDGIERSQQAFLKYGLFGLAIFVGAGSLISIFLRRLNRRTIGQNLTSLIIDISLLVIASTTLNSVILSNISNQEFSAIQASRSPIEAKISTLMSELPKPYNTMTLESIHQAIETQAVPLEVLQKIEQIDALQAQISDAPMQQLFARSNTRKLLINIPLGFGWLVSIVTFAWWFSRRSQKVGSGQSVPPVSHEATEHQTESGPAH